MMFRGKALQKTLYFHPKVIIYTTLAIAALLLSLPISFGSMIPLIIYIGLVYLFVLFKRPEIGFAISFLIMMQLFGMISRAFLWVKGYFKLIDIVIAVLFLSFIKEVFYKSNLRLLIKSPIAKALLLFMGSAIVGVIYAKLHYNISIISIIQAGRVYFFYSFFFLTLYHIRNKKALHLFLKIVLGAAILLSILFIGQHLIGTNLRIFIGAGRYKLMNIGSYPITRLGIRAEILPGLALPVMLGIALFASSRRIKYWAAIITSLFLAETILTLTRAHWFGVAFSCLFFWLFLPSPMKRFTFKYLIIVSLILILILPIISMFMYNSPFPLFSLIIERSDSGVKDFSQKSGTYGSRYQIVKAYWNLLKKNLVFGLGLLPSRSEHIIQDLPKGKVRNVHVGIFNIFIDLGLIGSIFFIVLVVVVINRSLYIFRNLQNQLYKAASLGILSAFIGRLAAFTLDSFTTYEPVTMIAVMLGLLEIMFRVDKEGYAGKKLRQESCQIKSSS